MEDGPRADYYEPGGQEPTYGFSAVPESVAPVQKQPEDYAKAKARAFPAEGGPAILEFELPDHMVADMIADMGKVVPGRAWNAGGEIRFDMDGGLSELRAVWSELSKRVASWRGKKHEQHSGRRESAGKKVTAL
jgi:hypothetical protein